MPNLTIAADMSFWFFVSATAVGIVLAPVVGFVVTVVFVAVASVSKWAWSVIRG